MSHSSRRMLRLFGVFTLTFAFGLWLIVWVDPFNKQPFFQEECNLARPQQRAAMAKSLIKDYLKTGMRSSEIINLLGPPDRILVSERDSGGNRLPGAKTMSYHLGSWSTIGFDDAFLYVHLDASDSMTSASIKGY